MISPKTAKNKQRAIAELLNKKPQTREELMKVKRQVAKKYKIGVLLSSDILSYLDQHKKGGGDELRRILRKRSVRTMSGIAPVAVLTKPYPCPGKCAYCPTEKNVPQSYLSNEPAVMRAIRCEFNPYAQVHYRLRALVANGHEPTKIELIVIGGTWSYLPTAYKFWYIKECFRAANDFSAKSQKSKVKNQNYNSKIKTDDLKKMLLDEQKKNEAAKYKIIGVTLETRPDYINEKELLEMRELGCTRVEIGVQAIDDKILKLNQRGSDVADIARATELLKNFGFKVTYHIMPALPGSTPAKDFKMYQQLFVDARFQPDQIKFYPTVVTKGSKLYQWWQQGKYKPYSQKALIDLIVKCKAATPEYVRIIRLIRDIPAESIVAGNIVTNLRQVMQARGAECKCIRCREAREQQLRINNYKLRIIKYKASAGTEYFISAESKDKKILYGFCRLRLGDENKAAMIRELHVYGELVPVGKTKKIQHAGLGKKLMQTAEEIARQKKYKTIDVIAGVGARGYYRQLGYKLEDSYMVKSLA